MQGWIFCWDDDDEESIPAYGHFDLKHPRTTRIVDFYDFLIIFMN